jgi:uncharacterized protein
MLTARNTPDVDSRQEMPVFFTADEGTLFGVFTRPIGEPVGDGVLVLAGGGAPLSTNRNRLSVRLNRRLAADGFHAMRFDYHGVGESTGAMERFRLHEPFVGDVDAATRWMERQGVRNFILVGSCFGARTALSAASRMKNLGGLILIAVPIRDFEQGQKKGTKLAREWSLGRYALQSLHPRILRGLFDPRRRRIYMKLLRTKLHALSATMRGRFGSRKQIDAGWLAPISPQFMKSLSSVLDRGVPVLLVYGTEDEYFEEFRRASTSDLGAILHRGRDRVELTTLPGQVHGFMTVEIQDAVLELVTEWIARQRGSRSPTTAR